MPPVIRDSAGTVQYTFPDSMRLEGRPRGRNVPSVAIPGRDGAVTNEVMANEEPRTISIVGQLHAPSDGTIEDEMDDIMEEIAGRDVYLSADEDEERYIRAQYENLTHAYIARTQRQVARVRLQFRADTPFWQSIYETTDIYSAGEKTVENGGNAIVRPTMTITGGATDIEITNATTGITFEFDAAVGAGEDLVIDGEEYLVTLDGDPVMAAVGGDFPVHGFWLAPGNNTITFSHETEITFRERWF